MQSLGIPNLCFVSCKCISIKGNSFGEASLHEGKKEDGR